MIIHFCIMLDMLDTIIKEDRLLSHLVKENYLTRAQLDTLLCEKKSEPNEKLVRRVKKRDKKSITLGAYLHTKSQAQEKIKRILKTIILLIYLDLLPEESIPALLKIIELITKLRTIDITEEEAEKTIRLIDEVLKGAAVIS